VRKIFQEKLEKDAAERIQSSKIAAMYPLSESLQDPILCSDIISKVQSMSLSPKCNEPTHVSSRASLEPVRGALKPAQKSLLKSACELCTHMDGKGMFSAKTVAALALVGSAATLMPSPSFDPGTRPFTRCASLFSYMPSSLLDTTKARPLEPMVFAVTPGVDPERKAAGNDSVAGPAGYAVTEHPPPPSRLAFAP
jgi:hypothetical protein